MLVQHHLRLVEQAAEPTRLGRFRELPADAAASHGRQWRHVERPGFAAGGQLEVPAVAAGEVESAGIGEVPIERVDNGPCLARRDVQRRGIGKDQALLVQPQMDRVGAEPDGAAGRRAIFLAVHAAGGVGGVVAEAEGIAERRLERSWRAALQHAACQQGGEAGHRQFGQCFAVVRFGPDEFGNDEGDLHAPGLKLRSTRREWVAGLVGTALVAWAAGPPTGATVARTV